MPKEEEAIGAEKTTFEGDTEKTTFEEEIKSLPIDMELKKDLLEKLRRLEGENTSLKRKLRNSCFEIQYNIGVIYKLVTSLLDRKEI